MKPHPDKMTLWSTGVLASHRHIVKSLYKPSNRASRRSGNRAESLGSHRPDPEAVKVDVRASGNVVTFLAVGTRKPCWEARRSGRAVKVSRLPGIGGPCPGMYGGRSFSSVAIPFTRSWLLVRNPGGVPSFQQDEPGLGAIRVLTFRHLGNGCQLVPKAGSGITQEPLHAARRLQQQSNVSDARRATVGPLDGRCGGPVRWPGQTE